MQVADMMWGWGSGGWWAWPMSIGMVAFWVAAIVVLVLLVKALASGVAQSSTGPLTTGPQHETPLDVLRRRYAAGEIEREEFEQKKRELS
ncbi:MAG TPA: SHOCT domain-containing protein [Thermoleophilia bacterium]|nr:SHOCT domain-containing protein [Thermoleophilia bacterium]